MTSPHATPRSRSLLRSRPSRIASHAILLAAMIALAACRGIDASKIKFQSDNEVVSWEEAKAIMQGGDVMSLSLSRQPRILINMADGTRYETTEPTPGAASRWFAECREKRNR